MHERPLPHVERASAPGGRRCRVIRLPYEGFVIVAVEGLLSPGSASRRERPAEAGDHPHPTQHHIRGLTTPPSPPPVTTMCVVQITPGMPRRTDFSKKCPHGIYESSEGRPPSRGPPL